ncbi:MAG: ferritin-like domain-containing protein [Solirubrobacterales bacterium]|nr:ferritin-like domain-containing protein [Solirubrobacterales bacterium]
MDERPSRRELMAGALAGGGVALALELAPGSPAVADSPGPSDAELLSKTLEVERLMVLAYERVLASGALSPGIQREITPFLDQEREHVSAVAAQLSRLGAPAPTGPLSLKAAADTLGRYHVAESLTDLHTEKQCLKLLVDLESVAEGASYTPIRDLRRPELVTLCAQIMACEAQHWTVLSGLRNPGEYVKAVPWPFVFGTK